MPTTASRRTWQGPPLQSSFRCNCAGKSAHRESALMQCTNRRFVMLVAIGAALLAATFGARAQEGGRPDVPALTRAYNASGQVLFRHFATGAGNIVFSPYSIGTAMAMALAGTRGDTEREMATVLQHSL